MREEGKGSLSPKSPVHWHSCVDCDFGGRACFNRPEGEKERKGCPLWNAKDDGSVAKEKKA